MARDPQPADLAEIQTLEGSKHAGTHLALLMKLMKPVSPRSTSDLPSQWTPGENNYSEIHLALLARLMEQEI